MLGPDRREFLKVTLGSAAGIALVPSLAFAAPRWSAPFPVAVIGCGRQGRALLGELAKFTDCPVVAVCDTVASRLSSGLRRVRDAKGYASIAELLRAHPEVQAVFVATPTHTHRAVALAAIEAGKHVYCEAPLAANVADALALRDAANSSLRVFQVGSLGRVNPIYALAHKFFQTGSIGEPVAYRAQSNQKNSWRVPPSSTGQAQEDRALNWKLDPEHSLGLVGELGVHQLDVLHWFANRYPTRVRGMGSLRLHSDGRELPDTEVCLFEFDDGSTCTYEATLANSYGGEFELVHGTLGAMKLAWDAGWMFKEPDAPTQGWEVYANRENFHNDIGITLIADATKLAAQDKLKDGVSLEHPPLYYGIAAFLSSCSESTPVACSANEGAKAVAVVAAAAQAVRSGQTVQIDPAAFESQ